MNPSALTTGLNTSGAAMASLRARGYRLSLRPGGLRLAGGLGTPPHVLALVRQHREGLISILEAEAKVTAEDLAGTANVMEADK